jgi:branched-chain amino acid transport system substrate-binding protein
MRRNRRRSGLIVAAVAAVVAVAGCSDGDQQSTTTTSTIAPTTTTISPRPADGALLLGAWLPRTGPGAALGGPMIEAVGAAVDEINVAGGVLGRPVAYEISDENADTGLDALLSVGVDAIVGPASSTVALSQLAEALVPQLGAVVCSPSATAIALDEYPDDAKLFYRTVPSDSLQMAAIARSVDDTGVDPVVVGYLDDPYGRGLKDAFLDAMEALDAEPIQTPVGFDADKEDLSDVAGDLLVGGPGVIVVLGDADDGTRLLKAIDVATSGVRPPLVVVNDALRDGRQGIQALSSQFRQRLSGVAPLATARTGGVPDGFFTANAFDCVNLIALAAIQARSDDPGEITKNMASVSAGGQPCGTFVDCATRLSEGLNIDYTGYSGDVDLSSTTGERTSAWFEAFDFDAEGIDHIVGDPFEAP